MSKRQSSSGFLLLLIVLIVFSLLLSGSALAADAAVSTTTEPTGAADSIYIAGNPSLYPLEYYDKDSGQYEGVLPDLLARVSARSGLRFTYVSAGDTDCRQRMLLNRQVELASGCVSGDVAMPPEGWRVSPVICSYTENGVRHQVYFAYGEIASDELIEQMDKTLRQLLSEDAVTELAVNHGMKGVTTQPWYLRAIDLSVMSLLLAAVVLLVLHVFTLHRRTKRLACQDEVTGIGNKTAYNEQFSELVNEQDQLIYTVSYIAFDISMVNRRCGEAEAEQLLRHAAETLIREAQAELVARVTGGGFALLKAFSNDDEAKQWMKDILGRLDLRGEELSGDYHPRFHSGIYRLPGRPIDSELALLRAREGCELAMTENESFVFVNDALLNRIEEGRQLQKATLAALSNREFKLYIQLLVSTSTGRITGGEALSRWENPDKGILLPSRYINLLERDGNIAEIDFYMFEETCRQLESWNNRGWGHLMLSCNFSRASIGLPDFAARLREISQRYIFDHDRLLMEITEDMLALDKETSFSNIRICKGEGYQIVLDDLGTGSTSFADMCDYPIDIVKLDKRILLNAATENGRVLLQGLIDLFHSLSVEVVCEGVESAEQASMLRRMRCDYLQGYYFYHAMPRNEAEKVLAMAEN